MLLSRARCCGAAAALRSACFCPTGGPTCRPRPWPRVCSCARRLLWCSREARGLQAWLAWLMLRRLLAVRAALTLPQRPCRPGLLPRYRNACSVGHAAPCSPSASSVACCVGWQNGAANLAQRGAVWRAGQQVQAQRPVGGGAGQTFFGGIRWRAMSLRLAPARSLFWTIFPTVFPQSLFQIFLTHVYRDPGLSPYNRLPCQASALPPRHFCT